MAALHVEPGTTMVCPKTGQTERVLRVNSFGRGRKQRHVRTNNHDHIMTAEAYEAATEDLWGSDSPDNDAMPDSYYESE